MNIAEIHVTGGADTDVRVRTGSCCDNVTHRDVIAGVDIDIGAAGGRGCRQIAGDVDVATGIDVDIDRAASEIQIPRHDHRADVDIVGRGQSQHGTRRSDAAGVQCYVATARAGKNPYVVCRDLAEVHTADHRAGGRGEITRDIYRDPGKFYVTVGQNVRAR